MTTVVSQAFTVSIISGANPYAGYSVGQCTKVYTGSLANQSGGTEPWFGILSFSGLAYDSATGTVYLHGGGHEVNDNSVWRTSVDTFAWSRDYVPDHTAWPNAPDTTAALLADTNWATYPGMWISRNRPMSRHTRTSMVWMPNLQKFMVSGGSLWGGTSLGDLGWPADGGETWLYDPNAKTWAWKGSTLLNAAYLRPVDAWYSTSRSTVFSSSPVNVNNRVSVVEYNSAGNFWSNHWDGSNVNVLSPAPFDGQMGLMAIDDAGDRMFAVINSVSVGLRVCEYSLDSRTWTERTTTNKPRAPVEGDALLYSSGTGRLTYVLGDGTAYWLNLATNAWSAWSNHPTGCGQILGARAYCPLRGVAFFVVKNLATSGVDIWAAKY